jgi:hypothetical protein
MKSTRAEAESQSRRREEVKRKLPFLIQFGNEDDIIAYTTAWNPNITEAQLQKVIRLFRDAQRARGRSPQ